MSDMDTWRKAEQERRERLNAQYAAEPWGKLAIKAGFDPYYTESAARMAFDFCSKRIAELEELLSRNLNVELLDQQQADRERIAKLEAEVARLRQRLRQAETALQPFSDRVYNDNGDMTVTDTYQLSSQRFIDAYFAYKAIRALAAPDTGGAGGE